MVAHPSSDDVLAAVAAVAVSLPRLQIIRMQDPPLGRSWVVAPHRDTIYIDGSQDAASRRRSAMDALVELGRQRGIPVARKGHLHLVGNRAARRATGARCR